VTATTPIELQLYADPGDNKVGYVVTNLSNSQVASGVLTTDIPASTTLLTWQIAYGNGTTAAATSVAIRSVYVETDN
jgi:hypothetical protein